MSSNIFHLTIGVQITPEELHFVARSGMQYGSGIKLQPDSMFSLTSEQHTPSMTDIMKIKSAEESKNLSAPTPGTKKKLHCYAVLTPSLAEAI